MKQYTRSIYPMPRQSGPVSQPHLHLICQQWPSRVCCHKHIREKFNADISLQTGEAYQHDHSKVEKTPPPTHRTLKHDLM